MKITFLLDEIVTQAQIDAVKALFAAAAEKYPEWVSAELTHEDGKLSFEDDGSYEANELYMKATSILFGEPLSTLSQGQPEQ